jgi:glycosidase
MPWDPARWDRDLLDGVAGAARLRTTTPALQVGTMTEHLAEGPLWVFERISDDHRLLVVVNNGDEQVEVDLTEVLPPSASSPGSSYPATVTVPPVDLVTIEPS